HPRGTRREDREVAPALLLELELRLHALHQLVVRDAEVRRGGRAHGVRKTRELLVAEGEELLRLRRVVPVDVDDHAASRNSRILLLNAASVCPSTATSQYCDFGRRSSRYRAAEVACDSSRPGMMSAGMS